MSEKLDIAKIYNCYKDFIKRYGYSPSYKQVRDLTGISIGYISVMVSMLVEDGYFMRPEGKYNIILTDKEYPND